MMLQTLLLLALAQISSAFVIPASTAAAAVGAYAASASPFTATTLLAPAFIGSSQLLSATTIDPTSLLSGVLGGIIGSPIILAVPILAALGVAFLVGWLIFAYASPQVEDDEQ
mmetsp:Transcript_28950/g.47819  ORF Transcript_28950/g.47819 Transcript_28950/m.47819 type:complete len:113 (-) Transcript_28950:188-526(-)|eukprot:CAMPEP_0119012944 /NCGR_PEP_ID=MMETSP1176-20130426/7710_1 /TAXON_ID=265551 /ORGANISM="Synedropsis recta cf, Strain CCMP1620" /LENGTH=112 /DNA_ID=CAMNT_0006965983 /DNA_START=51 /DNA_END=389 /DNA_ORIENTATION=-